MRKKGFTLIELLVVIAIIAMLLAILMPALSKVKKIAMRVVCGTNLKGLGTAQTVYANDYQDQYAVAGHGNVTLAAGNIVPETPGWNNPAKPLTSWGPGGASVGASLYLLVREADVSPKSYVCPSGAEKDYDGQGANNLDLTELWDFGATGNGDGPINCVSYSYHHPYTRFSADGTRSAAFAVMSDKNPWHDPKLPNVGGLAANPDSWTDRVLNIGNDWNPVASLEKMWINCNNAQPHDRDGQNVMFGDGHNSYEKRADVGIKHDNIFAPFGGSGDTVRQGMMPSRTDRNAEGPQSSNDSYLVNDDRL